MVLFDLNEVAVCESVDESVALTESDVNSSIHDASASASSSSHSNATSSNTLAIPKVDVPHELIVDEDGSSYWVPRVSSSVLPVVGTVFDSLEQCIEVYRRYASEAGFGVRLSTSKSLRCGYIRQRYLVCNREGCPKNVYLNTLDPKVKNRQVRSSNFRVCGCKARVLFEMVPDTSKYILTIFDIEHNHQLDMVDYKHLSKAEKKLTYQEQLFIMRAALANIGATRAHNLYTGLKGCSSLVHGTKTEFKNFANGLNCFIGDSDAQMLVIRMEERQKFNKDFFFDILVDNSELCGLFWADEVAKCNYKEFGDIISFDATYKTNKYKMVSVPFTAIDNHRKSVTVGSALLKRETAEYYIWLLHAFKKVFIHPPNIVVTDQDKSMKIVVATEFPDSKHRLCMWHIMQKIPTKIVTSIYEETDFKEKFGKIVWNMFIGPEEFEDRWNRLMVEFDLVNHKWLSKMYNIRSSWIPAFFVDFPLCGLMRTTSRSESENSFFSFFTNYGATLVKFMLCYESAMERQRQIQEQLDHQSIDSFPTLLTPLDIEKHASKVYTRSIFVRVQKEIVYGSWLCSMIGMNSDEESMVLSIDEEKIIPAKVPKFDDEETASDKFEKEINLYQRVTGHYKVFYNKVDHSASCCCQLFVRSGILFRHIFYVYKNFKVSATPDKYILRRWTKNLIPPALRNQKKFSDVTNVAIEKLAMEANRIVDSCLYMLRNNESKLSEYVKELDTMKSKLESELPVVPVRTVADFVQEFMGVPKPPAVVIHNPSGIRGRGALKQKKKNNRLKSGKEIAMKKTSKRKGGCFICGSKEHNKRTCPAKDKSDDAIYAALHGDPGNNRSNGASSSSTV